MSYPLKKILCEIKWTLALSQLVNVTKMKVLGLDSLLSLAALKIVLFKQVLSFWFAKDGLDGLDHANILSVWHEFKLTSTGQVSDKFLVKMPKDLTKNCKENPSLKSHSTVWRDTS